MRLFPSLARPLLAFWGGTSVYVNPVFKVNFIRPCPSLILIRAAPRPSFEARLIMQSEPNTPQTPFQISVADRVRRLPPYLFGKINDLKYRKRRAGIDVIDLGMGNPTDQPDPAIIDKLCEAARAENNHRYSVSSGIRNLRREVALRYERRHGVKLDPDSEVIAGLGSRELFSHMCLALLGPGDNAIVPAPSFPIHVYAVALAS